MARAGEKLLGDYVQPRMDLIPARRWMPCLPTRRQPNRTALCRRQSGALAGGRAKAALRPTIAIMNSI